MHLLQCLLATPLRTLWALSQANGLPCDRRMPKAALAAALHQRLAGRTQPRFLAQLPPDQLALLRALAEEPAPLTLTQFQLRFGPLQPYRPWREDAPRHPWRAPASAAEALLYQGLLFVIKPAGQPPQVILPAEVAATLRQPSPAPLPLSPAPPIPHALLDLALLLAYLQQAEMQPLHGRWLSPRHCRRLGACLAPPLPDDTVPSQRQSPRLAFAHYLAERLGLLTLVSGCLKPSPAAAGWLEQEPAQQIQTCWQTWLAPDDANRDLWRRFHLPGHSLRDPVGFAQRLLPRPLRSRLCPAPAGRSRPR